VSDGQSSAVSRHPHGTFSTRDLPAVGVQWEYAASIRSSTKQAIGEVGLGAEKVKF
jgi:hypothetical protein